MRKYTEDIGARLLTDGEWGREVYDYQGKLEYALCTELESGLAGGVVVKVMHSHMADCSSSPRPAGLLSHFPFLCLSLWSN